MQYETKHKTYEPCIFFMKSSVARDVVWLLIFSWGGNSSLLNCLFQWLHCMGVSFLRSWNPLSSDYLRWFCHVVWCQYVPFLFCVLFVSNAFFWCHSLPMIFGRWFCPRQVFRCHYLQIFRASFVWRRVLMPLFSDVLVLLLFHYGFWKPVFSDFVVLFFPRHFC